MSSLGIYFGSKVITIVEAKGKKLVNSTQIAQSTISTGNELEEKVPQEVKLIEIIALFKDEFRKKKIQSKEATLCLSGKDLIIRTFEIPIMPHEELRSAINFEAKKYIPFKVEELISDYQVQLDKQTRTNLVLFMGIKKEVLERYVSIFNQLDIKLNAIEYSAFDVLRCLKLARSSDSGVIGILGADITGEDEINFTVLENGFPLFSRDIYLAVGPEGMLETSPKASEALLEKLKSEVRISLDYYDRKFPSKNIKKLFLISSQEHAAELKEFIKEFGLSVHIEDYSSFMSKQISGSLSFIKAVGCALSKAIKTRIKLDLLGAKEKATSLKGKNLQAEALALVKGLKVDRGIVALGLLICIAPYLFGLYRKQALLDELKGVVVKRAQVISVNPESTYDELVNTDNEYKKKLDTVAGLINKQLFVTTPLNVIPKAIPKGVWLTSFVLSEKDVNKADLLLEGMVFLSDSDKEIETANRFLSNLKQDPDFTNYFKDISITSLDRSRLGKVTATGFIIHCSTYKAGE
jgi:hypothetical protein